MPERDIFDLDSDFQDYSMPEDGDYRDEEVLPEGFEEIPTVDDDQFRNFIRSSEIITGSKLDDYLNSLRPDEEQGISSEIVKLVTKCGRVSLNDYPSLIPEAIARYVFNDYNSKLDNFLRPVFESIYTMFQEELFELQSSIDDCDLHFNKFCDLIIARFSALLTYDSIKSIDINTNFVFLDNYLTKDSKRMHENMLPVLNTYCAVLELANKDNVNACQELDKLLSLLKDYSSK